MSGREDMSSYWCMWCMLHPSEWRTFCDNCDSNPDEEKKYGHWSYNTLSCAYPK